MSRSTRLRALVDRFMITVRSDGLISAFGMLGSYVYMKNESLLFERPKQSVSISVDDNLTVTSIVAADAERLADDLETAGVGDELPNFRKGAVCYLARWNGVPVGFGWRFAGSPLLTRAGYGDSAVYLGGFSVKDSHRGRGIYPFMLQQMCADLDDGCIAVVQASPGNRNSIRGLEKAGYVQASRISIIVVMGHILRLKQVPIEK